jgi:hypothetical protein
MLKLAGQILDVQDDGPLSLLRRSMKDDEIREKFASGEVLDPPEAERLDEPEYAAVFHKEASIVRRAYPVATAGQTLMSVAYFAKVASAVDTPFPEDVRNKIACNLVSHADLFQVAVPDEMRKWASDYGEYLPNDNWIDLAMHDSPAAPAPTRWAFSKRAGDETLNMFPCSTRAETEASLREFAKSAGEAYGLEGIEARCVAAELMKAAEEHGLKAPDEIVEMGSMQKRAMPEIHGLLLDRLERVPVSLLDRGSNREKFAQAIVAIEMEDDPIKMAGAIAAFDAAVDFNEGHYLTGLLRPHEVVFAKGAAQAEPSLIDKIGEDRLREVLGDDGFEGFKKDPAAAFQSLPSEVRGELLHG